VLAFLAGVLAANATPHFVKGITKEPFPSLLGPQPAVNLVAGWAMFVVAIVLLEAAHPGEHGRRPRAGRMSRRARGGGGHRPRV
jgi:hypothetical protein